MVAVSKPQHELRWENAFSHQMCKQGHFLLSEDIPEDVNQTSFRIKAPLTKTNQQLIKGKFSASTSRIRVDWIRIYPYDAEDFHR